MEQKMKKPVPPELRRAIRFKKRKKIFENIRISIATVIAAFFAILFLMPIVLTITNSFMSSSEISANYGSVFATNDKGGKVYISEKVNLKFIPDIVSFSQYFLTLLLGGGRVKTFAVVMVPYLQSGSRNIACIYSILFMGITLMVFAVFERIAGHWTRQMVGGYYES